MNIFTWIMFILAALLLVGSGICWIVFLVVEDTDWRRLAVKCGRLALVPVLFYANVAIYARLVDSL